MSLSANKIAFVHIPRSGGTTLGAIIDAQYKPENTVHFYTDEKDPTINERLRSFQNTEPGALKTIELLRGHFVYGFDDTFADFSYITMLRNPLERLISYYFYALSKRHHYLNSYIRQRRLTLDAFLQCDASIDFSNYQTRAVSGVPADARREIGPNELELAKQNLEYKFRAFGLTEYFEKSLQNFSHVFSWKQSPYQSLNVSKSIKPELEAATQAHVLSRNQYDIELYQFAKELFLRRETEKQSQATKFEILNRKVN